MANDTFAVDRMGQRLAYLLVPENGVSEVDADVLKSCALTGFDGCIGVALDPGEHVRFQIVLHETDASFLEFQDPNHCIWNYFKNQSCKRRFSVPIGGIRLQGYCFSRLDGFQHEGSGAEWRNDARHGIGGGAFGNDAYGKVLEKGRVGRRQTEAQTIRSQLIDCLKRF